MSSYAYTLLIPLIPFFVFVFVGLAEDKLKGKLGGLIGTAGLGIATFLPTTLLSNILSQTM